MRALIFIAMGVFAFQATAERTCLSIEKRGDYNETYHQYFCSEEFFGPFERVENIGLVQPVGAFFDGTIELYSNDPHFNNTRTVCIQVFVERIPHWSDIFRKSEREKVGEFTGHETCVTNSKFPKADQYSLLALYSLHRSKVFWQDSVIQKDGEPIDLGPKYYKGISIIVQ